MGSVGYYRNFNKKLPIGKYQRKKFFSLFIHDKIKIPNQTINESISEYRRTLREVTKPMRFQPPSKGKSVNLTSSVFLASLAPLEGILGSTLSPSNSYVEVLSPGTSECEFKWR